MNWDLIYNLANHAEFMNDKFTDRILVVDDNQPMRKALAETLKYLNYNTIEAGNGKEALELIESTRSANETSTFTGIALIMSDLSMPVMDGRELFTELKKRNIELPFIMLSGYMASNALDDLKKMGMSGWLQKPADIEQISSLLERILK
jgi:CheY-like chemotaxis protein